jgi:lipopolysaccharide/colanic/teichoic acid biosynthesis glycosyltransferase
LYWWRGVADSNRKILFVVTVSISLGFLRGQLVRLKRKGWTTGVVSSPAAHNELETFAEQEGAKAFPVQMQREINLLADVSSLFRLNRVIYQFKPHILNAGTPKAGLLAGLAGMASGVPIRIYTLHGLRLETVTGVKRRVLVATERLAMACAHRVVCVSPSLRDRVHQLGLTPAHKTVVLGGGSPNGVRIPDPSQMQAHTNRLRLELGLALNTPVIGFVGRFVRDKGIAELLAAYKQIKKKYPEARLLLIGDFEEGDALGLETRQAISDTAGIICTGQVPDVMPYYPLMNVLALPTYREGFPTVALEAAASALPVVTTDATGARDAVQPGITGWQVPVGDAQALAVALLEALDQPAEAIRRGQTGQQWVSQQFSPEVVQERWAEYYDELMEWRRLSRQHPEKRLFDLLIAGAGLITLSVPLLVLAVLVRSKLGSPVLFRQIRPGLHGQPFTMYKFRTMTDQRGPDGELLPDAVRLTDFGKFLRATSLDELPGLFNVLRGEMSLVGPRPLLTAYLSLYSQTQARRHEVRPGITGWAQVNGRNALSWEEKFEHDVWYVDHRSIALDLRILLLTVQKVFKREGISAQGEATMSLFEGKQT